MLALWSVSGWAADRPNILFISLDTTRADHLTPYGYERRTSPRLKQLADEGVLFERAYAPTSTTGPTHATWFTGLYPIEHAVLKNGHTLATRYDTLAEALQEAGYDTAAVISSFVLDGKFGYDQGFAYYDDAIKQNESAVNVDEFEGHAVEHGFDRRARYTTEQALAWLNQREESDGPFFFLAHYFEPHYPYKPPLRFVRQFVSRSQTRLEQLIALYDASLLHTDEEVGRLLDAMASRGLLENTLIVVLGDHGEGLGDHGVMLHGRNVHEEQVLVPFIVNWPDVINEPRRIKTPVASRDVYAMLMTVAKLDGTQEPNDLLNVLRNPKAKPEEAPIFLYRRHYAKNDKNADGAHGEHFAVVAKGWKYIHGPAEKLEQLFNLQSDPQELTNLVNDQPGKRAELQKILKEWFANRTDNRGNVPGLNPEDVEALKSLGYIE